MYFSYKAKGRETRIKQTVVFITTKRVTSLGLGLEICEVNSSMYSLTFKLNHHEKI